MRIYQRYLYPLFFDKRFYTAFAALILLFLIGYAITIVFIIAKILAVIFLLVVVTDYLVLFLKSGGITAERVLPDRLSNGDHSHIGILLQNNYSFRAGIRVIDELPEQFQRRDFSLRSFLESGARSRLQYEVRPLTRGEYTFRDLNVFVSTPLKLVVRRYKAAARQSVKVYPSFHSLKKFDLLAYSNRIYDVGSRKIRKTGHSLEFEQIREYVNGDDIRTLNWKATARKGGQLMVNSYTDERSQQVYCIIDKGRVMKMPFLGLTLLDYAINAALVLCRVALLKRDKAGLVSFSHRDGQILQADRRPDQLNNILESLYDQQTDFGESDYEKLYSLVRTKISQRSLIVLFTNFESLSGLQRQLPFIRGIARRHLVLTVFFQNTELKQLTTTPATDIETLYIRTIAEKFDHEKRLMVRELQQHGIFTILTPPEDLSVNTVNKYLELKARQAI